MALRTNMLKLCEWRALLADLHETADPLDRCPKRDKIERQITAIETHLRKSEDEETDDA